MKKRGRPSEQLRRETSEGRVWTIISKLRSREDFGRSIRKVARLCGCSIGAVAKTLAWRGYQQEKESLARRAPGATLAQVRRRRRTEAVEGRVMQIVKEASRVNDFSLTVRKIARIIGCSTSAVGKTEAWEGYVRARETDKEAARRRLWGQRIR
jgi:predicted acylesterase/phospholipase RssA